MLLSCAMILGCYWLSRLWCTYRGNTLSYKNNMNRPNISLVSMNVNGLNYPIKRSKVFLKISKVKAQIIFIQETHLSHKEHEKLKTSGFRNTFHSTQSHKRGVAILKQNAVNWMRWMNECIKQMNDEEGQFVIVKGKLENEMVTLINVYALQRLTTVHSYSIRIRRHCIVWRWFLYYIMKQAQKEIRPI